MEPKAFENMMDDAWKRGAVSRERVPPPEPPKGAVRTKKDGTRIVRPIKKIYTLNKNHEITIMRPGCTAEGLRGGDQLILHMSKGRGYGTNITIIKNHIPANTFGHRIETTFRRSYDFYFVAR